MILTDAQFYKLRFRLMEAAINRERAMETLRLVAEHTQAALVDAGLDPAKTYRFDEQTLSAAEIGPDAL